ncbi:PKHD-type hydroxylase [Acaryochloris thomasi RCC1774]|uniref:PKHD-type hydroxylase n=1 Tax=Acaryochloris thomasi RCC1774 TaxID=1764569 RepID=A0A2W1JRF7_9CYAN|nr:Fe2+-dependent dioxygenase [Acaryochloris thomasi]PZD72634.1 PKHD-type hydroxylase [Acaryochloris thomasi RCC1774]
MIFTLTNLLPPEEVTSIVNRLDPEDFIDGKLTAGWAAKRVKENTQLGSKVSYGNEIKEKLKQALIKHQKFQSAARPKTVHSMLISRYEAGMSYGAHVDNALMGNHLRSDLSFTIFLNSPKGYEGGELIIQEAEQDRAIKLEAGSVIVYPSSTLHRVAEVKTGVRLVAVGWVQSLFRDPAQREILYDLDRARRSIFKTSGKSQEFDWIAKSMSNLMRQWSDM